MTVAADDHVAVLEPGRQGGRHVDPGSCGPNVIDYQMVADHGLKPYALDDIVNWAYLDMALNNDIDQMSSLTKIFQAGWTEVWDSEETITRQLQKLRDDKIIP